MNAFTPLFAGVLLLVGASGALASSATEFTTSGRILPGACYPTLGNYAVDFGDISVTELQRHTATEVDRPRFNTLNISCDAATLFGIRGLDDRRASVGNHWHAAPYGVGLTPRGENIGAHYLEIDPGRSSMDGRAVYLTHSDARGEQWGVASAALSHLPNDGGLLGLADTAGSANGPVPVKQASLGLKHFLVIAPADELTLTSEVQIDGKAVIELIYL